MSEMKSIKNNNGVGSSRSKTSVNKFLKDNGMLIALVAVIVIFQILTKGIMLKPLNITNLIQQNGYVLILAVGMLLVVITGSVDLAVGSICAFVGALAGVLMVNMGFSIVISILFALLVGAAVGAFQGYWISYKLIPSFVVTLAGQLIFRGLTMIILNGKTIAPFPISFASLGSGFIPSLFYVVINEHYFVASSILLGILISIIYLWRSRKVRNEAKKYNFEVESKNIYMVKSIVAIVAINVATIVLASYKGIPNILIIAGLLILLYSFITNKTVFGRQVYAVGGNKKAAALSGVKIDKVQFLVFVNMGLMAALAGLAYAARVNSAQPKAGVNFELDALAACYIGGASTSGGTGKVMGAVVGGLVMGVLNNGMSLLGVDNNWQQAIKGLVLLLAVVFDLYSKKNK